MKKNVVAFLLFGLLSQPFSLCWAQNEPNNKVVEVEIRALSNDLQANGIGSPIGVAKLKDTPAGLSISVTIVGLTPGEHGFHVHQHANCHYKINEGKVVPGLAAGGHYDPLITDQHLGPKGSGHMGDLPFLIANEGGTVNQTVVAPRLTLRAVMGRSLIIHAGPDNYSDTPNPLGGGGARVACGVVVEAAQ